MRNKIILILSIFILAGCSGKFEYTKPTNIKQVRNSVIINKSIEDIWKEMIPNLAKTFFTINNIEKDSGFLNINYSGNPEEYIDCGTIYSYLKNLRGEQTYSFPASRAHVNYNTLTDGYYEMHTRKMNLSGKINITIKKIEPRKTLLTINTKYIITKKISTMTPSNNYSFPVNHFDTISFTSNGYDSFTNNIGQKTSTCYANGNLETTLINIIK